MLASQGQRAAGSGRRQGSRHSKRAQPLAGVAQHNRRNRQHPDSQPTTDSHLRSATSRSQVPCSAEVRVATVRCCSRSRSKRSRT